DLEYSIIELWNFLLPSQRKTFAFCTGYLSSNFPEKESFQIIGTPNSFRRSSGNQTFEQLPYEDLYNLNREENDTSWDTSILLQVIEGFYSLGDAPKQIYFKSREIAFEFGKNQPSIKSVLDNLMSIDVDKKEILIRYF